MTEPALKTDTVSVLPPWPHVDLAWRSHLLKEAEVAGWPDAARLLLARFTWDAHVLADGTRWEQRRQRRRRWLS